MSAPLRQSSAGGRGGRGMWRHQGSPLPPPKFPLPPLSLPRAGTSTAQQHNRRSQRQMRTLSSLSTVQSTHVSSQSLSNDDEASCSRQSHPHNLRRRSTVVPRGSRTRNHPPPHTPASPQHVNSLDVEELSTGHALAVSESSAACARAASQAAASDNDDAPSRSSLAPLGSPLRLSSLFAPPPRSRSVRSSGSMSAAEPPEPPQSCVSLICQCIATMFEPQKCVVDEGEVEIISNPYSGESTPNSSYRSNRLPAAAHVAFSSAALFAAAAASSCSSCPSSGRLSQAEQYATAKRQHRVMPTLGHALQWDTSSESGIKAFSGNSFEEGLVSRKQNQKVGVRGGRRWSVCSSGLKGNAILQSQEYGRESGGRAHGKGRSGGGELFHSRGFDDG